MGFIGNSTLPNPTYLKKPDPSIYCLALLILKALLGFLEGSILNGKQG